MKYRNNMPQKYGDLALFFKVQDTHRHAVILNQSRNEVYSITKTRNRLHFDFEGIKFCEEIDQKDPNLGGELFLLFQEIMYEYDADTVVIDFVREGVKSNV